MYSYINIKLCYLFALEHGSLDLGPRPKVQQAVNIINDCWF